MGRRFVGRLRLLHPQEEGIRGSIAKEDQNLAPLQTCVHIGVMMFRKVLCACNLMYSQKPMQGINE